MWFGGLSSNVCSGESSIAPNVGNEGAFPPKLAHSVKVNFLNVAARNPPVRFPPQIGFGRRSASCTKRSSVVCQSWGRIRTVRFWGTFGRKLPLGLGRQTKFA